MKQLPVSPADLSYHLLSYGVDTLVLNIRYANPSGQPMHEELLEPLVERLDAWQMQARKEEQAIQTDLAYRDEAFYAHPHGAGKGQWRWLLTNDLLNLCIGRGRLNGVIAQVRLSSFLLWSSEDPATHRQDLASLLTHLRAWLSDLLGMKQVPIHIQVSEVHLCADVTGWDVGHCYDWQATMLSRARRRSVHGSYTPPDVSECEKYHCAGVSAHGSFLWSGPEAEIPEPVYYGHRLETINFGSHGSALSCVIYNKTREITKSGKKWFLPIWAYHGHDGKAEVYRVETRWHREALHDFEQRGVFHGLETLEDLLKYLPYLWTYTVGHVQGNDDGLPDGWLRYVAPNSYKNPAFWPVHPAWQVVQSAFTTEKEQAIDVMTGEVLDLPISLPLAVLMRRRQRAQNIKRLVQQVAGCSATLAAWLGGPASDLGDDLSDQDPTNPDGPVMQQEPLSLLDVLVWLGDHVPDFALKDFQADALPEERYDAYMREFAEKVEEKRILYGLQSPREDRAVSRGE
jgi:hypothetical protein